LRGLRRVSIYSKMIRMGHGRKEAYSRSPRLSHRVCAMHDDGVVCWNEVVFVLLVSSLGNSVIK
jgi:hypothetical protein